jgi:dinuclear metal center YbgI/SA1388 family protein
MRGSVGLPRKNNKRAIPTGSALEYMTALPEIHCEDGRPGEPRMLLKNILAALDSIAPLRHAEAWDNVGLLAGDPGAEITRVLLTIDATDAVFDEARRDPRADLLVAYHPPLFEAIKQVPHDSLIHRAIREGIAIYSPHTALDVASGGTNDVLADALGMEGREPLRLAPTKDTQYQLVTFVPEAQFDAVSSALFAAGAGRIGQYSSVSFRSRGTATFKGEEGSNPTVGEPGKLERESEIRLETVVPIGRVDAVIRALREAHPYEQPAFDLVRLAAPPEGIGIGRIGPLKTPTGRRALFDRIKKALGVGALLVAGPTSGDVKKAAVCAGAGRSLLGDVIAKKADFFLTGELPHHDALRAAKAGVTVACALHSNSERAALAGLRQRLVEALPGLVVAISAEDRDPFTVQ